MQYSTLGSSGLKVSRVCLGMMSYGSTDWRPWVLSEEQGRPFIKEALNLGINFFDTADMYSNGRSEEILGRAIKDFAQREQVVVATKVFFRTGEGQNDQGLSRKHIMDAIDASLRRLNMDYVDLYQIHRFDYHTPIEETLDALNDVVRDGKARYLGASSMYAYQFATMLAMQERYGWSKFISMQNHYNLIYREEEREMIPLCRERGVGVIPWSPLARGFLAGNRSKANGGETSRAQMDKYAQEMYYQDSDFQVADRVVELARRKNVKSAQIALAWLLHQQGVTAPIIGATKMGHLTDAVAALEMKLDESERRFLEEVYIPHRVLGH